MESDSDTDSVLSCSPTMRRRNFGYIGAFKVCFWNILLRAKCDVMFVLISFLLIYASAALWCEHQVIKLCLSRWGEGPKLHTICCASLANPFILFLWNGRCQQWVFWLEWGFGHVIISKDASFGVYLEAKARKAHKVLKFQLKGFQRDLWIWTRIMITADCNLVIVHFLV